MKKEIIDVSATTPLDGEMVAVLVFMWLLGIWAVAIAYREGDKVVARVGLAVLVGVTASVVFYLLIT